MISPVCLPIKKRYNESQNRAKGPKKRVMFALTRIVVAPGTPFVAFSQVNEPRSQKQRTREKRRRSKRKRHINDSLLGRPSLFLPPVYPFLLHETRTERADPRVQTLPSPHCTRDLNHSSRASPFHRNHGQNRCRKSKWNYFGNPVTVDINDIFRGVCLLALIIPRSIRLARF